MSLLTRTCPDQSAASASTDPKLNALLAAMPGSTWQRWLPQLEAVDLSPNQVLFESGSLLSHVYFPTTASVSLLYVTASGASAQVAAVGNEGVVGVSLFMGGGSTTTSAVVQGAGQAYRLNARAI